MATRNIRVDGDEVLRKRSKEVDIINKRILTLIKDMADTMYKADGLGLAAPQVGVLKRVIVLDVGEGLIELINPCIIKCEGAQNGFEGCLSVPGVFGEVERPNFVTVEALNTKGEKVVIEGTEMLARVLCHEIDHLNGIIFKDKALRFMTEEELREKG